jgi:hypothetical protein
MPRKPPDGYPVWEALPPGVKPLAYMRSTGLTLVQCSHAQELQRPTGGYTEDGSDYLGRMMCSVCKGDEYTTETFALPVKMLAVVPEETALF